MGTIVRDVVTAADVPRILVATDQRDDADLVCKLLEDAYPTTQRSTDPDRFAEDFDKHRPQVLILAFKRVESAERYYLGLYRTSSSINDLPHRTLVLCTKDDVWSVYAQCCKDYFDDYVLFWPLVHDAPRLPMSVRLALRALNAANDQAFLSRLAAQARRIGDLEAQLDKQIELGQAHLGEVHARVAHARSLADEVRAADARGETSGTNPETVTDDADPMRGSLQDSLSRSLDEAVQTIDPAREWMGGFKNSLSAPLEAVRSLATSADAVPPCVLVVDDDAVMRDLLSRVLRNAGHEVVAVANFVETMQALRVRRPDLVIMDVMIPGIDGIQATRKLKALPAYADIPVIMLTGQNTKQSIVDSLRAGAVDYVVKPFERDNLLRKIQRRLDG